MKRGTSTGVPREATVAAAAVITVLLGLGWIWSIGRVFAMGTTVTPRAPLITRLTTALPSSRAPRAAFLTDATLTALADRAVRNLRGASGKLQAKIQPAPAPITPESLPPGASIKYRNGEVVAPAPKHPGIWNVLLAAGNALRPVSNFNVITMLPFSAKQNGRVGLYYVGNWPTERGGVEPSKAPRGAYAPPPGFIEVTRENAATPVSQHFTLGDFVTHDQGNVWPKYLVLQTKLIDKLELVLSDLEAHGVDTRGVRIMSGFRTPQYNAGGGNTGGRANLSRHMYGDASDIYIDNDHDGQMDDLNHDGRITIDDARVILAAVERVEAAHPELVGGAGVYTAAPGHGPFIHIDTRGYRARWTGTSGG
jgi:hypothetical protein